MSQLSNDLYLIEIRHPYQKLLEHWPSICAWSSPLLFYHKENQSKIIVVYISAENQGSQIKDSFRLTWLLYLP